MQNWVRTTLKVLTISLSMAIFNLGYTGYLITSWLDTCLVENSLSIPPGDDIPDDFATLPQAAEEDNPVNEKEVQSCHSHKIELIPGQSDTKFMISNRNDLSPAEVAINTPPPEQGSLYSVC